MARDRARASYDEDDQDDLPIVRRRRRPIWLFVFGMVLLVVLLLPTLVMNSSLRDSIIQNNFPIDGSVSIGSASFGWITPLSLNNVSVLDTDGNTVLSADAVTGNRNLLRLLMNPSTLGQITLTHPVATVVVEENGTNLQRVLAPALRQPSGGKAAAVDVVIKEGVVDLHFPERKQQYQVTNLDSQIQVAGADQPVKIAASGALSSENQVSKFSVNVATQQQSFDRQMRNVGQAQIEIDGLPLEFAEPLLRQSLPRAELSGWLQSHADLAWGQGAQGDEAHLQGTLELSSAALQCPALENDRIELSSLRLPFQIERQGDVLRFPKLQITSDLGQLTAAGQTTFGSGEWKSLLTALCNGDWELKGAIDASKLARMLPQTLHLREGTEITSGEIRVSAVGQTNQQHPQLEAQLEATSLTGTAGGRPISWRQPITMRLLAHQAEGWLAIDQFECDSNFFALKAQGTTQKGTATFNYDLSRLMSEISRFIELGKAKLSGVGKGAMKWETNDSGRFRLQSHLATNDFTLVTADRRPWNEPRLDLDVQVQGMIREGDLLGLETGQLLLDAGDEKLSAKLLDVVRNQQGEIWPIEVSWQGDLGQWLPRIESWLPLTGWDVAGQGDLTATVEYRAGQGEIQQLEGVVRNLRVRGAGLYIDEPKVNLDTKGSWDLPQEVFTLQSLTLAARSIRLQGEDLQLSRDRHGDYQSTGRATFAADLAQIDPWLHAPRTSGTIQMAGQLHGEGVMKVSQGIVTGKLASEIENLELVDLTRNGRASRDSSLGRWRERKVTLDVAGGYDPQQRITQFDRAELASDALQIAVRGRIASGSRQNDLDLEGKAQFDWQQLAPLWRQWLGPEVELVGTQTRNFVLRGPWPVRAPNVLAAISRLTGEGGVGWDQARIYGIEMGRADLGARLKNGELQVQPLQVNLSGGRLSLAPQFSLSAQPPSLALPRGPVAERIQLTPEICRQGLKYLAPLLAESTVANGEFSLNLVNGARFPLENLIDGEADGILSLNAEVRPGPVVQQLVGSLQQLEQLAKIANNANPIDLTLVQIDHCDVDFAMQSRRVYHKNLKMRVGMLAITTRGYVDLGDDTVDLLAQVELPESWLSQRPVLAKVFKNAKFEIPITGNLNSMRPDLNLFRNLGPQLLQEGAKELVTDRLKDGLDRGLKRVPIFGGNEADTPSQNLGDGLRQGLRNLLPTNQ